MRCVCVCVTGTRASSETENEMRAQPCVLCADGVFGARTATFMKI